MQNEGDKFVQVCPHNNKWEMQQNCTPLLQEKSPLLCSTLTTLRWKGAQRSWDQEQSSHCLFPCLLMVTVATSWLTARWVQMQWQNCTDVIYLWRWTTSGEWKRQSPCCWKSWESWWQWRHIWGYVANSPREWWTHLSMEATSPEGGASKERKFEQQWQIPLLAKLRKRQMMTASSLDNMTTPVCLITLESGWVIYGPEYGYVFPYPRL